MGEPCRDCRADDKVACASVCGLVAHYDRWLRPPMTVAPASSDGRTEFIAAITKLADDADFRASFLDHYNKWLSPPMMVTLPGCGGRTFFGGHFSDDVAPNSCLFEPGAIIWCPDTNDAPIEGVEIAPRPVMQALN